MGGRCKAIFRTIFNSARPWTETRRYTDFPQNISKMRLWVKACRYVRFQQDISKGAICRLNTRNQN